METKFQTSFIPRKPTQTGPTVMAPSVVKKHASGISSIYMVIAVTVFVVSVLGLAGAFAWKTILFNAQKGYRAELMAVKQRINEPDILFLKAQSRKLQLAQQLVSAHTAATVLFSYLSQVTTENVRFVAMDLDYVQGPGQVINLNLLGYAKNLISLAFQSDVLNDLRNIDPSISRVIKNPIITDPEINKGGTVSFLMSAEVDPNGLLYVKKFVGPDNTPRDNAPTPTPEAATE